MPDSLIKLNVSEGTKLRHLREQDSYSYDIAWIFVAGDTRRQLQSRYAQCLQQLDFRFVDLPDEGEPRIRNAGSAGWVYQ